MATGVGQQALPNALIVKVFVNRPENNFQDDIGRKLGAAALDGQLFVGNAIDYVAELFSSAVADEIVVELVQTLGGSLVLPNLEELNAQLVVRGRERVKSLGLSNHDLPELLLVIGCTIRDNNNIKRLRWSFAFVLPHLIAVDVCPHDIAQTFSGRCRERGTSSIEDISDVVGISNSNVGMGGFSFCAVTGSAPTVLPAVAILEAEMIRIIEEIDIHTIVVVSHTYRYNLLDDLARLLPPAQLPALRLRVAGIVPTHRTRVVYKKEGIEFG